MTRWLKNSAIILLAFLGTVGILASLGQYFFENEVKQYVKSALNKVLTAPVDVDEINFSLIQKFPRASISFEEVLAWDAFPGVKGNDTLFYAKRVFLEFNILDVIQKKYILREIEIDDADIRLKWNKKGEVNYIIWKEKEEGEETGFDVNLEKVSIKNSSLLIDHMKSAFISEYKVNRLAINGNINDKILDLECSGKIASFRHMTDDFSYSTDKELAIETKFYLDLNKKDIALTEAKLDWNTLKSNASGKINYGSNDYHFSFNGQQQELTAVLALLPTSFTSKLSDYNFSAKIDFSVETGNENLDDWKSSVSFNGHSGKIVHSPSAVSAKNLTFSGAISTYQSNTSIRVDAFSGQFSGGQFEGKFSMANLNHPKINAQLKGVFELAELIPFIKNDAITNAVGILKADMQFNGSFYDIKNIRRNEIERAITTGTIELEQIGFNLDKLNLELRELNGNFNLNDSDAEIPQLSGVWKGSQMQLKGSIKNFMPFLLLDNQKLNIKAEGVFDKIELEKLLSSSENTEQKESFEIPSYLHMEIKATIGKVNYKKFLAKDVYGHFIIQNSHLSSDDFTFSIAGGIVKSYLFLSSTSQGDLALEVQGRLENMAINKLFYALDNMGQEIITDKNINGVLHSDVLFKGSWDKKLNLDLSSIHVMANVLVDNGELKDLKSLEQIGDYLRSNAIASAFIDTEGLSDKLKNIHFDQLQNTIEIKNKMIYIPEMQILSDAVDINLAGKHSFDNKISYAMNFRLREIMKQKKETEFGIIEDDGLGSRIFLRMDGSTSHPIFTLDKGAKKEWKKETWSEEKKNINTILKDEFSGIFGGEKSEKAKEEAKKFEIEWDEDPDTSSTGTKIEADSLEGDKKGKTLIFQTDEDIRDSDDDDY